MLYRIESELPPNIHLPIPSSDPLHFYRYLWMHVLVEENQFLLLIDVPIQDRAQQIQIYQIINLPVPVGNYSMRYTMEMKYLGVTYDRTKAMDIPEEQFKLCKEVLPSFDTSTTTDKSALMRSSSIYQELKGDRPPVRVNNQSTTGNLPTYPTRTKCVGNHFITFQATTASNCYLPHKTSHIDTHITVYTRIKTGTHLQCYISALPLSTKIQRYPCHNELLHLQCKPRYH